MPQTNPHDTNTTPTLRLADAPHHSCMKLQADRPPGQNIVTAYGAGYIAVNGVRHSGNLLLMPQRLETDWAVGGFETLTEADFARLAQLGCDVLLLGTGSRQRFPQTVLLRPLIAANIGIEVMDSGAAARTYNVLTAEGRNVAAFLLQD